MDIDNYIVYKHTSPSGKAYIGITQQKPWNRWRKAGQGYKKCPVMNRAIEKYGFENFTHEILLDNLCYEDACKKEKEYIDKYNTLAPNGYNTDVGGNSGSTPCKKILAFNESLECRLFCSIKDAAKEIGVHPSSISKVLEKAQKIKGWFYIYSS